MRIGIFFGGPSREREISYAGGKTAFEHLDKSLFQPVPVFVDSFGRFILLRKEWMYQTSIRDFYPAPASQREGYLTYVESLPQLAQEEVPASVGTLITPDEFKGYFDFALLAMHGPDCEDGAIQGLLEWYRIPYSGPGLMGSAVGIDKVLQNEMIALANGQQKRMAVVTHQQWQKEDRGVLFAKLKETLDLPLVVKAPHQGSSIGVAIVKNDAYDDFVAAINQCFFQLEVPTEAWHRLAKEEKHHWAQRVTNLDEGIGFPVVAGGTTLYHPQELVTYLDAQQQGTSLIASSNAEDQVLLEEFVNGQEFSCGCIQFDDGTPLALPPTEVVKIVEVFDFNAKYRPGTTRKRIPVGTSLENNRNIQRHIATVFQRLGMNVCARIDGFLTADDTVLLHDPNTIPGMSPSSLIFKQMAEIGLSVTHAITYFIRQSIRERIRTGKGTWELRSLLEKLDQNITAAHQQDWPKVGIVFSATDEQYAQARAAYSQLNAEGKARPVVVLKQGEENYFILPNQLMFKESVDEVLAQLQTQRDALIEETVQKAAPITTFYAGAVQAEVAWVADLSSIDRVENWIVLSPANV
ncbi:hypothetical protein GCM10027275_44390 [Rhabdobacter roseus]|uniref:D-alanine--D-alanine ligase n=1 Tax=Rhabdobacter roseus TaxID=1655419 RepID=A0A840TT92_9BACT|nr:D-alanine--D-alanine ligase [Rhabdobacter roseus]MBB5286504.1 D-alanine-D-alanine ligase [Rhabdobacter roseus]